MRLSLEGFGEEFEIGKIAFELEDLKKDKEKRREKIGDFSFLETNLGLEGWYIYICEKRKRKGRGSTHWRHWRGREEKHAATRREWLQQKTVQVCSVLLSMFLSLCDFSTWSSFRFNIFYIVDWSGRKGLLRLLCWSWFLLFIMLSFIFRSSLFFYWFQDAIYISINIMITNSFVCWIWLLVIVCLSRLFKARWFEIWNAALPSSFCSYFIFIFIFIFSFFFSFCTLFLVTFLSFRYSPMRFFKRLSSEFSGNIKSLFTVKTGQADAENSNERSRTFKEVVRINWIRDCMIILLVLRRRMERGKLRWVIFRHQSKRRVSEGIITSVASCWT